VQIRSDERKVWMSLAELFFLDNQSSEADLERAAALVKEQGWSPEETEKALVEVIAPVAGSNLGYLIYPVIGEWDRFEESSLIEKLERRRQAREQKAKWRFFLSDWWSRRMMRSLSMEALLKRL
jgi:hypothetical protein